MSGRPWWEDFPREYWTPEDHQAARLAGVPSPARSQLYEPLGAEIPIGPVGPQLVGFGSLFAKPGRGTDARKKLVDAILASLRS